MKKKSLKVLPISNKLKEAFLTAEEKSEIRALDKNCAALREQLGDLQLRYDIEKNKIIQAYGNAQKSLNTRALSIAEAHGVDIHSTTEKWHFDTQNATLKQQV